MLKRLFFGLGVLLGVLSPEISPVLAARLYRSADAVYLNAEVEEAFAGTALELAEGGTRVAFRLEATIAAGGREFSPPVVTRSLHFDRARGLWIVDLLPEGGRRGIKDREAACIFASRIWSLRLAGLNELEGTASVRLRLSPGILDESGGWHAADILWGYAAPARSFTIVNPRELPY